MVQSPKHTVLILCTGNSCRSQLAEALINARMGDRWQAFSAGIEPGARVHPLAIQVLREIGIGHAGRPKHTYEFFGRPLDLVITVCDDAAENCPVWLGRGKQAHISFPDPARATGTHEEVLQVFRSVRDDIADKVLNYLNSVTIIDTV